MITVELKYHYSELDKTHCYYLPAPTDAFDGWRWFHLGKHMRKHSKNFRLYPFHPSYHEKAKTILTLKINDASKQGEMIAKKINKHYLSKIKC